MDKRPKDDLSASQVTEENRLKPEQNLANNQVDSKIWRTATN